MGVEEPFGMRNRARKIVDQNGRCRRGDDRLRPGERGSAFERLALEIEHLRRALKNDSG